MYETIMTLKKKDQKPHTHTHTHTNPLFASNGDDFTNNF